MSKKGVVRAIAFQESDAIALANCIRLDLRTLRTSRDEFVAEHYDWLSQFEMRLRKASRRKGRQTGDVLRLWTVTQQEAIAAFLYVELRVLSQRAELSPLRQISLRSAADIRAALVGALRQARGRARISPATAAGLLDRYRNARSGLQYQFGGRKMREVKRRLAIADRIAEDVKAKCGTRSVQSVYGRDLPTIVDEILAAFDVAECFYRDGCDYPVAHDLYPALWKLRVRPGQESNLQAGD